MRIVFISSLLPSGHFSEILCSSLQKHTDLDISIYTDMNPLNKRIKTCKKVKMVWRKGPWFMIDILKQLQRDKPALAHIQQELNMYGGGVTVLLFPLLLFCIKLMNIRVVTTIHAAVYKKEIDNTFVSLFLMKPPWYMRPFVLKFIFNSLFLLISWFSDIVVSHSNMLEDILTKDYGVQKHKSWVIRTIIPKLKRLIRQKDHYFLVFGYIVRRKGLQNLIDGFSQFHKKHSDFKLILAGGTIPGQERARDELYEYVKRKKMSNSIVFTGFVNDKQIDKLYKHAYAVLIPAYISMGSSGPLYHAQSYSKCILASDVGHFKEDIQNNINGILVNNSKWNEYLSLIVDNQILASQLEQGIRKEAQNKSPKKIAATYRQMYQSLMK
ncbi:MAG: glycosyltransferase family 4 protein [bacterium]|nr:glycosyltransferase family 4 protein [bacterium]